MARVTVALPRMLAEVHGRAKIEVEGSSLREAVEALFRTAPALRFHLSEDSGKLRTHVLCFVNDELTSDVETRLRDGDRIAFIQAISGG
jgi:molybdopterin converting factor small subunit